MLRRIRLALQLGKLLIEFQYRRIRHHQLYVLISTPSYGNVGDHTIELAQQEILRDCGLKDCFVDISSIEYAYFKKILTHLIQKQDIIIIDGGGNIGDVWPTTIQNINNILLAYPNNRFFVFPESWYFSDTESGRSLLRKTVDAFNSHREITVYARDMWSYNEMRTYFNTADVKYSFDAVLLKKYEPECSPDNRRRIGMSFRDDAEAVNKVLTDRIYEDVKNAGFEMIKIKNDNYAQIGKKERTAMFETIVSMYEGCDVILTDRFHGFIFSLLCHKPCVLIDNLTGKVLHFYDDIKNDISGCTYIVPDRYVKEELIRFIASERKMVLHDSFYEKRNRYLTGIKEDLIKWREHR